MTCLKSMPFITALALSVVACGANLKQLDQTPARNAQLTTEVKAALIQEENIDAASIRVTIENATMVLTGFVGTETELQLAEQIANEAQNDLPVDNQIKIP